jgi:hypothetical protein
MKHVTLVVALLICLSCAKPANADAIYDFSLPANGSVSALDIQLTFPGLLAAGGLNVIGLTQPLVTSLSFPTPGFTPFLSVIGIQVTPTSTLIGLSLRNAMGGPLLFTNNFPGDFFVFNRTPLTTGTFSSVSGNVISILPLATGSPTGTLTVTQTATVPEPSTVLLFGSGLLCIASLRRLRSRRRLFGR